MKRVCVIGWPIEHSRSPLIHGYWLSRYGIDGCYIKEALHPEAAAGFLRGLRARGYAGCNVTVPLKEIAYAVADRREASAVAVGAANTVWLDGEQLVVANTDAFGFMAHLDASAPQWRLSDGPVSVLGAGGAARAIVHGLLEAGVSEVRVFNRTPERAVALEQQFGSRVKSHPWGARSTASRESCLVVNTTSLGLKGQGRLDVDFAGFRADCVVCDIVYVPLETQLLQAARTHGLATVDGLGMLLHQAVPGFEKWFGVRPEVTAELRAMIVADIKGV